MANHFAFPEGSHFGSEFALGVEPGILGDPYPRHPRGQARAGHYIDRGRDGGSVITRTFSYTVPDGSNPDFPVPAVGERIYVARWYPKKSSLVAGALLRPFPVWAIWSPSTAKPMGPPCG